MKCIHAAVFLLLVVQNCISVCISESIENNDWVDDEYFLNYLNPLSLFYNKGSKSMVPAESEELQTDVSLPLHPTGQYKDIHEYIFYKRLVKVLLSNIALNINRHNVSGYIKIEGTAADLDLLQDFVDGEASIREADRILCNVIKEPPVNNVLYAIQCIIYLLILIKENIQVILSIMCGIMSYLWLRNVRWSPVAIIFSLIMVIFVISFFIIWYQMIMEAKVKHMVLKDKLTNIPSSCQPDQMNMWDKFAAYIRSDDSCEKYYQSIMSNPILEVTPALALMHLLTTIVFHPISYAGVVLNKFIGDTTANAPFIVRWIAQPYMYLCVGVLLILFPIALITGSLSLGLGPFRIMTFKRHKERNSQKLLKDDLSNIERIEDVRKVSNDIKATKNDVKILAIRHHENCSMGDGDKIRKSGSCISKDEICRNTKSEEESCSCCDNTIEKDEIRNGC